MRPSFLATVCLVGLWSYEASAANYTLDAGLGGRYEIIPFCPVGCLNDYVSPVYSFKSGDTVNFGSLLEYVSYVPGRTGNGGYIRGTYGISYEAFPGTDTLPRPDIVGAGASDIVVNLVFSFSKDTEFQIAWNGAVYTPSTLTASVPEPSAWAMMMLGLAGLGLAMRYRLPSEIVKV